MDATVGALAALLDGEVLGDAGLPIRSVDSLDKADAKWKKIAELQNLRATIDGLIKKFDAQEDNKLKSLVKIYENMKPKEAAQIFEDLEMETLLEMSERMKERKLAAIIAKMTPEKAREVTVELRRLRELPNIGEQVGG